MGIKSDAKTVSELTMRQARDQFYKNNGFPADGGVSHETWSIVGCRDLKVYLPNFEWRKKAIPKHDLHHIITGYPFSPAGEFQISAWEFAAGRYRNFFTTLFCLPLVSMGAIWIPKRTFAAFVRGRNSKTLYGETDYEKILAKTVEEVRRELLPQTTLKPLMADRISYLGLVTSSALVIAAPFVLLGIIWLGLT